MANRFEAISFLLKQRVLIGDYIEMVRGWINIVKNNTLEQLEREQKELYDKLDIVERELETAGKE